MLSARCRPGGPVGNGNCHAARRQGLQEAKMMLAPHLVQVLAGRGRQRVLENLHLGTQLQVTSFLCDPKQHPSLFAGSAMAPRSTSN